jgi:hypothetical protein
MRPYVRFAWRVPHQRARAPSARVKRPESVAACARPSAQVLRAHTIDGARVQRQRDAVRHKTQELGRGAPCNEDAYFF